VLIVYLLMLVYGAYRVFKLVILNVIKTSHFWF